MCFTRAHWQKRSVVWVRWFFWHYCCCYCWAILCRIPWHFIFIPSLSFFLSFSSCSILFVSFLSSFLLRTYLAASLTLHPFVPSLRARPFFRVILCVQLMFSFYVCVKHFSAYYSRLDKEIRITFSNSTKNTHTHINNFACGIEPRTFSSAIHFISPHVYFIGSKLVHCVILFLFFSFSLSLSLSLAIFHHPFRFSCIHFILFIFSILVDSGYFFFLPLLLLCS